MLNKSTIPLKPYILMTLIRHSILLLVLLALQPASAQFFGNNKPALLPEAEAYKESLSQTGRSLSVFWSIADDYYMYRDQFAVELVDGDQTITLEVVFQQPGVVEIDPEFGAVEVYFFNAAFTADLPIDHDLEADTPYQIILKGQGCNKPVGVCYPPMSRSTSVTWTAQQLAQVSTAAPISESQEKRTQSLTDKPAKSFWAYVLSAFGAGLLLSFTPCVLPMIPILSGVIAKQHSPNNLRAGWLATCYVAGTVVTYLIAGAIAGATGTHLQAYFQSPWVIGFICLLLILLASSLFGAFKLQTPTALQSHIHNKSSTSDSYLALKSFGLGLVSALVVGACVSPVLILALGAAISQGDPILGSAIMGSMAMGMGVLLIAFGFGAGWILPKTGAWMEQVQSMFGFMVLGVAIFIASALTPVPVLLLWSLLLLAGGFFIWQLADVDFANERPGLLPSIGKAIALATMLWGVLALIGYSVGGRDIVRPLSELQLGGTPQASINLPFETTTTLAETQQILENARDSQQPVLIDFYADWCFDCVRMKRTTFKDPIVADALKNWRLVIVDVTDTSTDSEELKRFFDVFGPPATLFIKSDGSEAVELRQYGFIKSAQFISLLSRVEQAKP